MDDLKAEIARVRALCDAATPGPWKAGRPDMATIVDGVNSKWVYAGEQYCAVASGRIDGPWDEVMANAAFIAASRTLVPRLLAALELAIEKVNEANSELEFHEIGIAHWRKKADAAILAALRGES